MTRTRHRVASMIGGVAGSEGVGSSILRALSLEDSACTRFRGSDPCPPPAAPVRSFPLVCSRVCGREAIRREPLRDPNRAPGLACRSSTLILAEPRQRLDVRSRESLKERDVRLASGQAP